MARQKSGQDADDTAASATAPARARLVPTQQRSRERYERILACASEVMVEKGCDAFRMSDIVERAGISFGSLYQYFPDKAAVIGTLAERYNEIGHECVRRDLARMHAIDDLHDTLCRITDSYYRMFVDEPLMRDIWRATQADRALQALDRDDGAFLTALFADALEQVAPGVPRTQRAAFAELMMVQIAAAVRHAITLPPKTARQMLAMFKRVLPREVPGFGA
ncbi:TetR/AcrR family transcriptional regulator [Burkholderia pseudomultivorans]|uniref:HTH-type transcriptional regulator YvdT n=1 Tax=Burkholderia pseudomultivorans TaxID=1207504 RepID=A0ABU2E445_9BURK|nr:TetR/AcrR family transcriptional regulator [Burkholderia pseudomultivorans]MDR8728138.1 putative HTH-type transcriptional regulator YvdT [Burkholderia pseudomultivorans]MDR8737162.1 putative HTH-type transcriptional regulator YvdT [Burkholderia pseudomultivorans]MDR8740283.1 putative HTH-type transcriptional regulator YvdT [Burkholderia pseudomultivorans]MDR8754633.1 putative HTH-type transcriptional regulator YvdT [Burkholderia pseudomultivorans]MDR8776697.1 putative HTH-type transcription